MDLEFTEDQAELAAAVRTMLDAECPSELARAVVERGDATGADQLWKQMVELGWPAVTVPEDHGGLGLGPVEATIVLEELGRHVAPGPYLATVSQLLPALREANSALLDELAAGAVCGALADGGVTATRAAAQDAAAWHLDGEARFVQADAGFTHLAVVADSAEGEMIFVVPASAATFETVNAFDASRPAAHVTLRGVGAGAPAISDPDAIARVRFEATLGIAAETLGVCQALFDATTEYVKEREQFGVPIGSFQAVKHKLVDVFVAIERARALVYFAALTLAERDDRAASAVSMAKAGVGDAQQLAARESIQLHGGVGYTWESDVHLFVKRAKMNDTLFGGAAEHRGRVADLAGI